MFKFFNMLFPKLWFGMDGDLNGGGQDPNGQLDESTEGNTNDPNREPNAPSPTEELEISEGIKVQKSVFEQKARELFKDAFDAQANRDKWQAENTRKAQEIAQAQRDAEAYRRLMAEQRTNQRPTNPHESARREYIEDMKRDFPDLDERFLAKQFDWNMKLAEQRAKESLDPFFDRQGQEYEKKFLQDHPKVVKGSEQYNEILQLTNSGVDPEKAYRIVFFDDIVKDQQSEAIKRREEEAKRKLQQTRTTSTTGTKPKPKDFDEAFERAWSKHSS